MSDRCSTPRFGPKNQELYAALKQRQPAAVQAAASEEEVYWAEGSRPASAAGSLLGGGAERPQDEELLLRLQRRVEGEKLSLKLPWRRLWPRHTDNAGDGCGRPSSASSAASAPVGRPGSAVSTAPALKAQLSKLTTMPAPWSSALSMGRASGGPQLAAANAAPAAAAAATSHMQPELPSTALADGAASTVAEGSGTPGLDSRLSFQRRLSSPGREPVLNSLARPPGSNSMNSQLSWGSSAYGLFHSAAGLGDPPGDALEDPRGWLAHSQAAVRDLVEHPDFTVVVLLLVLANCVQLALFLPLESESSPWNTTLTRVGVALNAAFSAELLLRCWALGSILEYLRSPWNLLDAAAVVAGWAGMAPSASGSGTVLRAFRALRPLRAVTQVRAFRAVVVCLLEALPLLASVAGLLVFVLLLGAIAGTQLFMDDLNFHCIDPLTGQLEDPGDPEAFGCGWRHCPAGMICKEYNPSQPLELAGYGNVGLGILSAFQVISTTNWSQLMYRNIDSSSPAAIIYYVLLIFLGGYFVANLFVAVLFSKFARAQRLYNTHLQMQQESESARAAAAGAPCSIFVSVWKRLVGQLRGLMHKKTWQRGKVSPEGIPSVQQGQWWAQRAAVLIIQHSWFNYFFLLCVLATTGILASYHAEMSLEERSRLGLACTILSCLFMAEAALKLAGLGLTYFKDLWNSFEFLLVLLSAVDLAVTVASDDGSAVGYANVLRALRLFRVLRLLKAVSYVQTLRSLCATLLSSLGRMAAIFGLLLVAMLLWSLVGMALFGSVLLEPPFPNYNSFFNSLIAVFQVLTTEEYDTLLFSTVAATNWGAALYYPTWVFIGRWTLVTLFLAVTLSSFQERMSNTVTGAASSAGSTLPSKKTSFGKELDAAAGGQDTIAACWQPNRPLAMSSSLNPSALLQGGRQSSTAGGGEGFGNAVCSLPDLPGSRKQPIGKAVTFSIAAHCTAAPAAPAATPVSAAPALSAAAEGADQVSRTEAQQAGVGIGALPAAGLGDSNPPSQPPDAAAEAGKGHETDAGAGVTYPSQHLHLSPLRPEIYSLGEAGPKPSLPSTSSELVHGNMGSVGDSQATPGLGTSLLVGCLGVGSSGGNGGSSSSASQVPRHKPTAEPVSSSPFSWASCYTASVPTAVESENEAVLSEDPTPNSVKEGRLSSSDSCIPSKPWPSGSRAPLAALSTASEDSCAAAAEGSGVQQAPSRGLEGDVAACSESSDVPGGVHQGAAVSEERSKDEGDVAATGPSHQEAVEAQAGLPVVGACRSDSAEEFQLEGHTPEARTVLTATVADASRPEAAAAEQAVTAATAACDFLSAAPQHGPQAQSSASAAQQLDSCPAPPSNRRESACSGYTEGSACTGVSGFTARSSVSRLTGYLLKRSGREYPPLQGTSLYLLKVDSPLRSNLYQIVTAQSFEFAMMFFVVCSCIQMALETPSMGQDKAEALAGIDIALTSVFWLECLLKLAAFGFLPYWKFHTNKVDLLVVLVSTVVLATASSSLRLLKSLRVLRALKPLRMLTRSSSMLLVLHSLALSVKALGNVALLALLFFVVMAILGVHLFMGALWSCNDLSIFSQAECVGTFFDPASAAPVEREWSNQPLNFDNTGAALLTLFVASTLDGYTSVMSAAMHIRLQPDGSAYSSSPAAFAYFLVFITVGGFVLPNLFTGVLFDQFSRIKQAASSRSALLTPSQQEFVRMVRAVFRLRPEAAPPRPANRVRAACYWLVTSRGFEPAVLAVVLVNVVLMACQWYGQPLRAAQGIDHAITAVSTLFIVECVVKLLALGPACYWRSHWRKFDGLLALACLADILLQVVEAISGRAMSARVVKKLLGLVRTLRMTRIIKFSKGMRSLLTTLVTSLPAFWNVGALLLLVLFVYSYMGVMLFGSVAWGSAINEHANFSNFLNAYLTLFRLSTGDNWADVMLGCMSSPPGCSALGTCGSWAAVPYFVSFTLLVPLVLLELFKTVLIDNFEADQETAEWKLTPHHLEDFCTAWAELGDGSGRGIRPESLEELLRRLKPPLGLGPAATGKELLRFVYDLDIPLVNGFCPFHKTALELVRRCSAVPIPEGHLKQQLDRIMRRLSPPGAQEGDIDTMKHAMAALHIQKWWRLHQARQAAGRWRASVEPGGSREGSATLPKAAWVGTAAAARTGEAQGLP